MTSVTSPLKWHGGKHYLASRLAAMEPVCTTRADVYCGGLSYLLATNPNGVSEVANDLYGEVSNFWYVLREPDLFAEFHRLCTCTPFSQPIWESCADDGLGYEPVPRAWRFFVRCRQSLAGRFDAFAPLSRSRVRRGMNEQASAWLSAVDGLYDVHQRLQRVVILNVPALRLFDMIDDPETFFYCDPCYPLSTRTAGGYAHDMNDDDHRQLLQRLQNIRGKFMLSTYPNQMYEQYAAETGWTYVDFSLPNNAASGRTKRAMVERVYKNY